MIRTVLRLIKLEVLILSVDCYFGENGKGLITFIGVTLKGIRFGLFSVGKCAGESHKIYFAFLGGDLAVVVELALGEKEGSVHCKITFQSFFPILIRTIKNSF